MSSVVWEWGFNLYDRYSQMFSLYAYQKGEKKSGEFERAMGGCLLIIGNNRRFFIVSWCSKRVTRCNMWELSANSHNGSCEVRRAWNPSGSPSKLIFVWEKSEVGVQHKTQEAKLNAQVWGREWLHIIWKFGDDQTSWPLWWVGGCGVIRRIRRKIWPVDTHRMENIRPVLTVYVQESATRRSAYNNKVIWSCHMVKQVTVQVNTKN